MSEPAAPPPIEPWHPPVSMPPLGPSPPRFVPPQRTPEPSAPPRRRWLIPVIILACLVPLALTFAGAFVVVNVIVEWIELSTPDQPEQPLVEGEPGSPVAANPMQCPPQCFDRNSVHQSAAAYQDFVVLGVGDTTHPNGTYESVPAGELYRGDAAYWAAERGKPDHCVFVFANAPYASSLQRTGAEATDLIHFIGTQEDPGRRSRLDQAVRLFATSALAEEYMKDLSRSIETCSEVQMGEQVPWYRATTDPAPTLGLPGSIAEVGWTLTGDPGPQWRTYIIHLQRGNLVVTNHLVTDGSIAEPEFRDFVTSHADKLAALTPILL